MGERILLCGENGAGKSTLGGALARRLGCPFLDIEDYYFPKRDAGYPYGETRTKAEAAALLLNDLRRYDDFVLAAVKGDYGAEIIARLTFAVLIRVPKELRMERVRARSYQKFGARMLPGGDLYEREEQFFTMVQKRVPTGAEDWLKATGIPWIAADGTMPAEDNAERITAFLNRAR